MEKPMSLFGTLLVLLIVSIVIIVVIIAIIFDRVDQHKQEDLRRKRETAQKRSATVVSIEHKIDWAETIARRGRMDESRDAAARYKPNPGDTCSLSVPPWGGGLRLCPSNY